MTLVVMSCAFLSSPLAQAGIGVDLAAAGCGAVAGSMLTTEVAVDPHLLTFTTFVGDVPPEAQTIVVACYDVGSYYDVGCSGSLSVDQPWLKLDRTDFYGVDTIAVRVDPADLTAGTYEGKIHVSYDFVSIDDEEDVRVELTVQE